MMRLQEIQGPTHEIPPVDTSEKKFSGRSRLYIGNINPTTSEEKLKEEVSKFGHHFTKQSELKIDVIKKCQ